MRRKKTEFKKFHARVENVWKEACKERDDYQCQYCGSEKTLQVHHIVSRTNASTFYDLDNGITLCKACHTKLTFNSVFRFQFQNWLAHKFGQDFLDNLERKSRVVKKWDVISLERKLEELVRLEVKK